MTTILSVIPEFIEHMLKPSNIILYASIAIVILGIIMAIAAWQNNIKTRAEAEKIKYDLEAVKKEREALEKQNVNLKDKLEIENSLSSTQKHLIQNLEDEFIKTPGMRDPISPLQVRYTLRYRISDPAFQDFLSYIARNGNRHPASLSSEEIKNMIVRSNHPYLMQALWSNASNSFCFQDPKNDTNTAFYWIKADAKSNFKIEQRGEMLSRDGGQSLVNDSSYILNMTIEYKLLIPEPKGKGMHDSTALTFRKDIYKFDFVVERRFLSEIPVEGLPYYGQSTYLKFSGIDADWHVVQTNDRIHGADNAFEPRFHEEIVKQKLNNTDKYATVLVWRLKSWDAPGID